MANCQQDSDNMNPGLEESSAYITYSFGSGPVGLCLLKLFSVLLFSGSFVIAGLLCV